MSEISVPDYVPTLRKGTGKTPQQGGCLVQVAGWLYDGVSWSDDVECVHPLLRGSGINVNDRVSDEDRHRLALLAPRISGSADAVVNWTDEEKHRLEVQMAVYCARSLLDRIPAGIRDSCKEKLAVAEAWLRGEATATDCSRAAIEMTRWDPRLLFDTVLCVTHALSSVESHREYGFDSACHAAASVPAEQAVDWYAGLVDEFDRLTGRATTEPLPRERWDALRAEMAWIS